MNKIKNVIMLLILTSFYSILTYAQNPYQVTRNDYQEIRITFNTPELQFTDVKTDAGYFTKLALDGFFSTTEVGQPELPKLVKNVEIPICENVNIQVIPGNYTLYSAEDLGITHPIFPAQPSYSKSHEGPITFRQNINTYTTNNFYGETLATITPRGILRSVNFAELTFSPIQYNPITHQIKVYESAEVRITFTNADIIQSQHLKNLHSNKFFNPIQMSIINPIEQNNRAEFTSTPIRMVIVAHAMFREQLENFVAWKKRKGFLVDLVYTDDPQVGNTTTSIKNYLKSLYNNATPTNPAPTFLLLVGDVAQIPAFSGTTGSHVTDLYYATWSDGDNLPDCYYGRFSANNINELTPQIEKTLLYEKYEMEDPSYLNDAVLVAGTDSYWGPVNANGQINYLSNNYVNTAYGFSTVHTHLYNCSSQAATIRAEIGAGVGYANYTAHCGPTGWSDPTFENQHVPAMNNANKYGLMIGNCCQSNKFDQTCFGETLLRAANKGAIGYIGASNNTYWNEDFYWSVGVRSSASANPTYDPNNLGAYDRLFHTHNEDHDLWMLTNGSIVTAGNLSVQSSSTENNTKLYYWEIYHLMGDPSLMSYLSEPEEITASYSSTLMVGSNSLIVETEPYAYIALTYENTLLGATFADANGNATLTFNALATPGIYELAIWAQNHIQYFGNINVIVPEGSYVIAEQVNTTPSIVTNNARIGINCAIKNVGVADASNVYAILSSTSPLITILQDSIYVGNIAENQTITFENAFLAQVEDNVVDKANATLSLTIHSDNNTSTKTLPINIVAPQIELESYTISNINGSQTIQAGDTLNISITHKNSGRSGISALYSSLSSFNSEIIIPTNILFVDYLRSTGTCTTTFQAILGDEIPENGAFALTHKLFKGNFACESTIYITLGTPTEDFETGDFTSFEWGSNNSPWIITDVNPYAGTYSAKSANNLGNNSASTLTININTIADGNISYYRKVSSENNYDFFRFYIDGTQQEELSGNVNWGRASFPVPAGEHTLKFEYSKDVSTANGSDCAWIDNIEFPPMGSILETNIPQLKVTEILIDGETIEAHGPIMFDEEVTLTFTIENDNIAAVSEIGANLSAEATSGIDGNIEISNPNTLYNFAVNSTTTTSFTVRSSQSRSIPFKNFAFNLSLGYNNTVVNYPFTLPFENHAEPEENVGISNNTTLFNLTVSPNPIENQLYISSEQWLKNYEISDLNGKIVYQGKINNYQGTLNLQQMASGIYLLKVTTSNGDTTVQKIVKK